ncbi:acyltransferase family protein [Paraurantiacibacter namhicola]|uniref:acyltransferase family protein n=1 Tax=Paraurantiacibacter namhicola TaxID=645517 RepID=UPI000833E0FE|nr:acyltransferase [Paraurantiacibacter namhicola]
MEAATQRVQAIQLIRVLAAFTVAAWHFIYLFAPRIGPLPLPPTDGQLAQVAVCAFFIVSGYVMVISSEKLFARPGASRTFWLRRAIRILPTYWLALAAMVAAFWLRGMMPPLDNIARSAVFWLYWTPGITAFPSTVLGVAWTLFYEMLFYLIFGFAILRCRNVAVILTGSALVVLVVLGMALQPANAVLFAATRPISLVFIAGMAIAILVRDGWTLPMPVRTLCILGGVAMIAGTKTPESFFETFDTGFSHIFWAGLPALLLCLGLLAGRLTVPGFAIVDRLADASYALYLFHLPIGVTTEWAWMKLGWTDPWSFVAMTLSLSCLSALAFHSVAERPLVRRLNRLFGTGRPAKAEAKLSVAP